MILRLFFFIKKEKAIKEKTTNKRIDAVSVKNDFVVFFIKFVYLMYFSFSLFARQRFFTSLPNWYCDYKSVLFTPKVPKERESTLLFPTTLRLFLF